MTSKFEKMSVLKEIYVNIPDPFPHQSRAVDAFYRQNSKDGDYSFILKLFRQNESLLIYSIMDLFAENINNRFDDFFEKMEGVKESLNQLAVEVKKFKASHPKAA